MDGYQLSLSVIRYQNAVGKNGEVSVPSGLTTLSRSSVTGWGDRDVSFAAH